MPKLKPTKAKDLVRILKKIGFVESRTKGSHLIMKNKANLLVVIPLHNKEIPTGTLLAIISDAGLNKESFMKLLSDKKAIDTILMAEKEPTLKGDLDELAKKFR